MTKSIVALLLNYKWNKFSIVVEDSPRWQLVADALVETALNKSMTVNHREMFEDLTRCCASKLPCCHIPWQYNILEKTRKDTRSNETFFSNPRAKKKQLNNNKTSGQHCIIMQESTE